MCTLAFKMYSLLLLLMMMAVAFVMDAEAVVDVGGLSDVFWEALGTVSVGEVVRSSPESGLNQSCFDPSGRYSGLKTCLLSQCVSGDDVARLYGVTSVQPLDAGNLSVMSAGLVYVLTQTTSCSSEVQQSHEKPPIAAVWGFGFLFVTLINICSLFGACVLPCVRSGIYKVMLLFMVALAVGTLVGSGLLVLIPEALELPTLMDGHGYVWKVTTVMGGIYLFFLVERIMRIINNRRENTKEKKERDKMATAGTYTSFFKMTTPENPTTKLKDLDHIAGGLRNRAFTGDEQTRPSPEDLTTIVEAGDRNSAQDGEVTSNPNTATTSSPVVDSSEGVERVRIAPVAYMIIFGDALHNMIDGLSIGAAFTESTLLGISLSVAVMCEELPHELGDFAILLNSGMSVRRALLFNFLSSLSCYVGLIIGIQLGENTSANTWIFAIAGGMFLYISLADMLPEMNSAADSPDGKNFGEIKTLLVQNFGMIVGFGIILLLALYGGEIQFQ